MSSNLSNADYLNNVIIPSLIPMIDQKIPFMLFDYDDRILVCSNRVADEIGYPSWLDLRGQIYKNLSASQERTLPNSLPSFAKPEILLHHGLLNELHHLKQFIFRDAEAVSCQIIHPFSRRNANDFYTITYIPIFAPNREVIAVLAITTEWSMFRLADLFSELYSSLDRHFLLGGTPMQIMSNEQLPVKLTPRQHEIVFLLSNGLSQRAIASILGISRGAIAKTLSQSICPKFNIWGSNTVLLIESAKALKLNSMLPLSFCRPRFIILDNQIALRYHAHREQQKI